jgi:hypothetical protein
MTLAVTGMRASEALSVRICDLNLDSDPPRLFLRGEYIKTKTDMMIFLTVELANQLKNWLSYKYRTRRVTHYDSKKGKSITELKTPARNKNDLIFSMSVSSSREANGAYSYSSIKSIKYLYNDMIGMFGQTLDSIGKGAKREDLMGASRREVHLHLFRALVKSTISDLGHNEFGEYHIGHKGSAYYRKSDKEKVEIFKKIESYLTFLDVDSLDERYGDMQSRIEDQEIIITSLKERNQTNVGAISEMQQEIDKIKSMMQNMLENVANTTNQQQKDATARTLLESKLLRPASKDEVLD